MVTHNLHNCMGLSFRHIPRNVVAGINYDKPVMGKVLKHSRCLDGEGTMIVAAI